MAFLSKDIESHVKKGLVYGTKGTEVSIIRQIDHVCLCEDSKGNKFPVPIDCLTEIKPDGKNIERGIRNR